jgi:hypothetical protein
MCPICTYFLPTSIGVDLTFVGLGGGDLWNRPSTNAARSFIPAAV